MSGKSRKQIITELCQMFDVKYRLVHKKHEWGWAYSDVFREIIEINLDIECTKNVFVSLVLHEISHIVAYRQGRFKKYHADNTITKSDIRALIRTAVRAEIYVDKQAEKLMKGLFPGMRFHRSYRTKEEVAWFHEIFLKSYKELLK